MPPVGSTAALPMRWGRYAEWSISESLRAGAWVNRGAVTSPRSGRMTNAAIRYRKARLNEARGGARTYVACDGDRVAGFYSLAASSVERRRVSSRVGRNIPEPIPVILLGQLADDTDYQGRRLGSDLLVDAACRAHAASDLIGSRAIVVQAIDKRAKFFCARFGFRPCSEREPLMLLLRTSQPAALLEPWPARCRRTARVALRLRTDHLAQDRPDGPILPRILPRISRAIVHRRTIIATRTVIRAVTAVTRFVSVVPDGSRRARRS